MRFVCAIANFPTNWKKRNPKILRITIQISAQKSTIHCDYGAVMRLDTVLLSLLFHKFISICFLIFNLCKAKHSVYKLQFISFIHLLNSLEGSSCRNVLCTASALPNLSNFSFVKSPGWLPFCRRKGKKVHE